MAGISRAEASLSVTDAYGTVEPVHIFHALSQTIWFPIATQVANGASEQSIIVLGTQGLTTITAFILTSDQDISVTYGTAGNNEPVDLNANALHAMSGTSLTALAITNASGSTANIKGLVAGS